MGLEIIFFLIFILKILFRVDSKILFRVDLNYETKKRNMSTLKSIFLQIYMNFYKTHKRRENFFAGKSYMI